MSPAPLPFDEEARLARLRGLAILDTAPEPIFDSLTRIASEACGAPIALFSLVDSARQWFKSNVGLSVAETPRDVAFCAHAILQDALLEVPDATRDPRFAGNPLVTGAAGIRFYAGAPVVLPGGQRIGTICVMDRRPRQLEPAQRRLLIGLSDAATQALLMRNRLTSIVRSSLDAIVCTDVDGVVRQWNSAAEGAFGYKAAEAIGLPLSVLFDPEHFGDVLTALEQVSGGASVGPFNTLGRRRGGEGLDVSVAVSPLEHLERGGAGILFVIRDIGELKSVERELRLGESKFRILSDASPIGVFHTDANGRCTYANQRWQQIFGLSLEQSQGDAWGQTLHPDDRNSVVDAWTRSARDAADFDMEFRVVRRDGTTRHVRSRGRPIPGLGGTVTGYVGVVEDITDKLLAEQRQRAARTLLDRTERITGVGGWELDLQSQKVTWSDQTRRIHEVKPGHQPTLADGLAYYTRESRPLIARAVQEAISHGTSWDLELPFVTAMGRPIWVRSLGEVDLQDGKPVRLVGAFQDITSRRQAEDALQESRRLLRVLYESTPAMLHSNDADGRLLTVTDVWLATLGYRRDQVIGRPLTDFLTDDSRRWLVHHTRKELFRVGAIHKVPFQMVCSDGTVRDVLTSSVIDLDPQGERRRTLVFLEDVTDDLARKAELERERALRQRIERDAADLNRLLIERSDMLDVLAHEVRQPLNNASAAIQSAVSVLAGDEKQQVASGRLHRAQSVMTEVLAGVDNTLAAATLLAGGAPIERHDTDIDTLIGVAIGDMPAAERSRIAVDRATTTRTATMDMSLMRLALRNLMANALKYSPPGSPLTLRIADSDEPLALIIEVADSGCGFAPALLERLFERGARGSSSGHGLGLYIVRRVMDLHGGHVELVRNSAQGSTLRLVIAQSAE